MELNKNTLINVHIQVYHSAYTIQVTVHSALSSVVLKCRSLQWLLVTKCCRKWKLNHSDHCNCQELHNLHYKCNFWHMILVAM